MISCFSLALIFTASFSNICFNFLFAFLFNIFFYVSRPPSCLWVTISSTLILHIAHGKLNFFSSVLSVCVWYSFILMRKYPINTLKNVKKMIRWEEVLTKVFSEDWSYDDIFTRWLCKLWWCFLHCRQYMFLLWRKM